MKDLTVGREGKLIFLFAMPMLLGQLFQQFYSIVDSAIVGKFLGKEALAAVGASFPIIFTMIALMIGIASGGMVVISQYFGAKDIEKVKKVYNEISKKFEFGKWYDFPTDAKKTFYIDRVDLETGKLSVRFRGMETNTQRALMEMEDFLNLIYNYSLF